MVTTDTVFKLVIPEWINQVPMETVIAKYYTIKDKLPKKYEGSPLKKFGKVLLYVDTKNRPIVSNPTKVGNKVFWRLNGQNYSSKNMHFSKRSKIRNFYVDYFTPFINSQFKEPFPIFEAYRINMHIEMYEIYQRPIPDITNMWILAKLIEDCFVVEKVLRDDSPEFRKKTSFSYTFIDTLEERKLEVIFTYEKI